jgi:transcriptional regulator with XRE-family HTH domain
LITIGTVPNIIRPFDRGTALGRDDLREVGGEFREKRLSLGLSQAFVANACRISRSRYAWIEAGRIDSLTIVELHQIASVLGLDVSLRIFPGGAPLRDSAQVGRLGRLLSLVQPPLVVRTEVPLPVATGRWEQRAWDAVISGHGERTAVELEMRLRDLQATERRATLKRRDDPTDHFLLVVAATRGNRGVLAEVPGAFPDLSRLRLADVRRALEAGVHPPTGLVLL